jgi:hypothetical protein
VIVSKLEYSFNLISLFILAIVQFLFQKEIL